MNARRDWRSHAACRGMSGEIFFPTAVEGPTYAAQVAVAKAVCAGCPVRSECLDEALARIPDGIAGGLTAEERRALRRPRVSTVRSRTKPPCGDREAAGRVLLTSGQPVREVARRCGVSERTAARWAARLRALTTSTAEGSSGGHRAPLLISHTNPQPGTRAEGLPL